MAVDDGYAVHYTAVPRGTPVYGSDEIEVGKVEQIVDNYREHIFDGVVFTTASGEAHFVDAPEVARTAERAVTLTIPAEEALLLPPPDPGAPEFQANPKAGKLTRFFGGSWRKKL